MVIIKESVLKDPEEIQARVDEFVNYFNRCLKENRMKKLLEEEKNKTDETA